MQKSEKGLKKGSELMKKAKLMRKENNNIFWIFSEKIWKNVEKSENDENGSDIDRRGQNR